MLYTAAFKEAINLAATTVTGTIPSEPVKCIRNQQNEKFGLVSGAGKKQLPRSTMYQAAKDGLAGAGQSPKKRGAPATIPEALLKVLATHAEVCECQAILYH